MDGEQNGDESTKGPPPPTFAESLVHELVLVADVARTTIRSNDAFKEVLSAIVARLQEDAELIRDYDQDKPPEEADRLIKAIKVNRDEARARTGLAEHYQTVLLKILVGVK